MHSALNDKLLCGFVGELYHQHMPEQDPVFELIVHSPVLGMHQQQEYRNAFLRYTIAEPARRCDNTIRSSESCFQAEMTHVMIKDVDQ